MSIFSDTIREAINVYRRMLRKYMPQDKRMLKLRQLNLKNAQLYENEIALYHTGKAIVSDIEKNLDRLGSSYYAYSGVGRFAAYLKSFLKNYEIESNQIIHRSQKASRALVRAIQLLNVTDNELTNELTEDIKDELMRGNVVIAECGSVDQYALYKKTLRNAIHMGDKENIFYRILLTHFQEQVKQQEASD
jgi:hypothetical protein